MAGLELDRLALIICKRRKTNGVCKYAFGTGYFLTPQLVLTASHVIPEDAVEILVRSESTGARHEVEISEQGVRPAWRDPQLDAVLLRATPGLAHVGPVSWMDVFPLSNLRWHSTGYPIAAAEVTGDQLRYTTAGLEGTLYAEGGGGQGIRELDLSVEAGAAPDGWRGISGAPVFVQGTFAGIIKQVPNDFRGGRLRGLPAPTLLMIPGFREALEPEWLRWPTDRRWALIVQSDDEEATLMRRVKAALNTFNAKYLAITGGQPFEPEPLVAKIQDAICSPERWLRLVKALCQAPVMVADVTKFQPGVMLALGVRAVVRRSVTIASTADHYEEVHLGQLPFNIQEAKLISHGGTFAANDPKNPISVISSSIRDGLVESRLHSRYLDLPAYDAVRSPVPEMAAGLQAARESVLVLCSFQPNYSENWKALSDTILAYSAPKVPVRMLDLGSPRLVGQALYEYIRWAGTCVVDWSGWRPNVFFELGVRLACTNAGAMSVIDRTEADAPELSQKRRLLDLFRPSKYDRDNPHATLKEAFEAHLRTVSGQNDGIPKETLAQDATFQIATAGFAWEEDGSIMPPHRLLKASVEEQVGKDPQRSGVPPVLFSVNQAFRERVRTSMQERWIAAWYYLTRRYPEEIKTDVALRRELKDLGENVLLSIPVDTNDVHLEELKNEVVAYVDAYDGSEAEDSK